jgi:hypothetical protein
MAETRLLENRKQIKDGLRIQVERTAEKDPKPRALAIEVQQYWKMHEAPAPWNYRPESITGTKVPPGYATGDYANSIHVRQQRGPKGRFISSFEVYTYHPNAHYLEYGTDIDNPDSQSPWGRYTPTPEFAPAARTAHHFGAGTR